MNRLPGDGRSNHDRYVDGAHCRAIGRQRFGRDARATGCAPDETHRSIREIRNMQTHARRLARRDGAGVKRSWRESEPRSQADANASDPNWSRAQA